jgi:hypothetical protein
MPEYWLSCSCGQKTTVSTAQAGETIYCACGAALEVPTLRGLAQLERADGARDDSASRRGARAWEDRHRAAFLFVMASLAFVAVAGYLWFALPPRPAPADWQQTAKSAEELSATEAFQVYTEMSQGLPNPAVDVNEKPRRLMGWGIAFAAFLAAAFAGGAAISVLRPSRRRA